MKRFVGSMISAALSLTLVGTLGCGGGDKGGDTTPATTEDPVDPAVEQPAEGEAAEPAEGEAAEPAAGGDLTAQLEQANKVWADSCSSCHGDKGEGKGKKNPAVVGGKALDKYKNGGDLLTYIKEKMPKDDPGSLSEADYLAVTAWLLSQNGRLGETNDAVTVESAASISLH